MKVIITLIGKKKRSVTHETGKHRKLTTVFNVAVLIASFVPLFVGRRVAEDRTGELIRRLDSIRQNPVHEYVMVPIPAAAEYSLNDAPVEDVGLYFINDGDAGDSSLIISNDAVGSCDSVFVVMHFDEPIRRTDRVSLP